MPDDTTSTGTASFDKHSTEAHSRSIFISYAHEVELFDQKHKLRVRTLAELLKSQGHKVAFDHWNKAPRQDWNEWTTRQIPKSDFVIVIASPTYRAVSDGEVPSERNKGIRHELAIMRELVNDDRDRWFSKILPVILPECSHRDIPLFLGPTIGNHYIVPNVDEAGIKELIEAIEARPESATGEYSKHHAG
jgi:hypothetical protein